MPNHSALFDSTVSCAAIAAAWQIVANLNLRILEAQLGNDCELVVNLIGDRRAAALNLCVIPALAVGDTGPKTMCAALIETEPYDGGKAGVLRRIERAITADMARLQPPLYVLA